MSRRTRAIECRRGGERSRILVPIAAIVVMLGFAGLAFADAGEAIRPVRKGAKHAKPIAVRDDGTITSGDSRSAAASSAFVAPPANDTCAGAEPLTLGITTKGTTVGANDDYQTPANTTCYAGEGQTPTTAPGRDVVYSFTAPADGNYSFRIIQQNPNDVIRTQNEVLYLTDCANAGTVDCAIGANRGLSASAVSWNGATNNQSEQISCYPMTTGQTTYLVFDDGTPGNCSVSNHACFEDANCPSGETCTPALNTGGVMSVEVINCVSEVEPNDDPATATPYACGIVGSTGTAPLAHCYLGTRAGNVCTRSSFLDQNLPNSNMRCSVSGGPCVVDLVTGLGNCPVGELCQQQTDLDCDPRCDIGPNAGKTCTTHAFCNPVSDQGATCAGSCQAEATCIDTATGADTATPCTPTCTGSSIPSVNGRYCSTLSACPGGGTCSANGACPAGTTCGRQFNEGDTDYYSVGTPPAGSKVFVGVDAKGANDYDWRMRVTSATNTLQFDDDDVTSRGGSNAPAIAGAVTDGSPTFIQVSRTSARKGEPYEVFAIVRGAPATAQLEDESGPSGNDIIYYWPGNVIHANYATSGGYVRGTFGFQGDSDCFKFLVNKGDLMDWFGDGGPGRTTNPLSTVNIPQPIIYDAEPAGISNFIFGANPRKNTAANVQGPGLRALSPAVTSSYFQWRASYTGMVQVCFYDASFALGQGTPAHPNDWVGSLSVNCGPLQPAGPGATTADVAITKTGPAGPVQAGQLVDYTITVTNNGTEIAQEVRLEDTLDSNLSFVSLTVDDTLGGNNTACFSLPTQGTADVPIDCINTSMAPGSTTTYVLTVQVNNCIGAGVNIDNTATITTVSTDPDPGNDQATASFTTSDDGSCVDLVCDGLTCVADLCTENDHCDAGICVGDAVNCDDASLCTDDSCDPAVGCVNDSSQAGDLCDDFDQCTANTCDPIAFCVFPFEAPGTACDDGIACTGTDQCDGQGTCAGSSVCDDGDACTTDSCDPALGCVTVPVTCDDGDACTTDSCDPALGCVTTPLTCDDSDVCNGSETCDPASGCVAGTPLTCGDGNACNGAETCDPVSGCEPGTPLTCNDANACTTDSCDSALGCVFAPITCNDGNACNGTETCNPASGCVAGTAVVCTALDQCHDVGTCAPGTGLCSNPLKPTGTACADGNACTTGDTCNAAGACTGGPAPTCTDDGDACTADICDPATGCVASVANFDIVGFSASRVDGRDLVILADAWSSCSTDPNYDPAANLDHVGCIDLDDFHLFMNTFGRSCQ